MSDIFISYAREDLDRARRLASALESRGWSVWWDRRIVAGQTFDQTIERELESARSVVVLWSKDSIESEWTKNEATAAAERNVLVPALLDDVRIPLEFRRKQTANLIDWDGDASHEGFQALCEGIAGRIGAPAVTKTTQVPPPPPHRPWSIPAKWRTWAAAAAAGAVAITAVTLWWTSGAADQPEIPRNVMPGDRQPRMRRHRPLPAGSTSHRRMWAPYRRRMRTASTIRRPSSWAPSRRSHWNRTRTTISGCLRRPAP